jgi:hypothetical protein
VESKFPLKDFFDSIWRLTEVLRNNRCCGERKLIKEIGENLPQNMRRKIAPELVLAGHIACFEAGTSLFDLTERVCCRSESSRQFFVNSFGAKTLERRI